MIVLLQLLYAFDLEGAAQELLRPLLTVVYVMIWSVTPEPFLCVGLLRDVHAEVWLYEYIINTSMEHLASEERRDDLEIWMLIPHVRELHDLDLLRPIDTSCLLPCCLTFAIWTNSIDVKC